MTVSAAPRPRTKGGRAASGRRRPERRPRRRHKRFHDPRDRIWMLSVFAISFVVLRLIAVLLWDEGREPMTAIERVAALGMYGWITTIPSVVPGILAWVLPRRERPRRGQQRIGTEVSWRVVSRGLNPEALAETVLTIRDVMRARPLFPYRIEVVTDTPVALPPGDDVHALVVPEDWESANRSLYKARALHWALHASSTADDAWVVHLDEESHPTTGLVGGLRDFLAEAEEAGDAPVGQGCILYHRHLRQRPIMTLADSLRTGDDVSRFFAQYRWGQALFGMHGSFIVVRNDVARGTGFDVGPDGSITEDAWWALDLVGRGHRFAWVDGHVVEQAPESVEDFVKQRRRWFSGLVKVALYAPAPWWATSAMLSFLSLWAGATVGVAYTWLNIVLGLATPGWLALTGAACYAWYVTIYLAGLRINLAYHQRDVGPIPAWQRAVLYVAQVALMPLFAAMETTGVVYALIRPERGFHVIRKSATSDVSGAVADTSPAPAPATAVAALPPTVPTPATAAAVAALPPTVPTPASAAAAGPSAPVPATANATPRRPAPVSATAAAAEPTQPVPVARDRREPAPSGLTVAPAAPAVTIRLRPLQVVGAATPRGPVQRGLLAELALAAEGGCTPEQLAVAVWSPPAPRRRVVDAVSHLRATLGAEVVSRLEDGRYRLGPDVVVDRRRAAASDARDVTAAGDQSASASARDGSEEDAA